MALFLNENTIQMKNTIQRLVLTLCFISFIIISFAQKKKISLKDSLDGAFDLSDYIIEANGFVPVPFFITEPALGGFGLALIPVFIKKRPPYIDSINGERKVTPVAPDITGGLALYTVNNTWMTAVFRSGTFVRSHIKYRAGAAYANINMSFYRTVAQEGEKEFKFNIKAPAVFFAGHKKNIGYSNWYAGLKYLFLKTDVQYIGEKPDWVKPIEYGSIVSQLGTVVELDNRDNIFTPDKGMKAHVDAHHCLIIFLAVTMIIGALITIPFIINRFQKN